MWCYWFNINLIPKYFIMSKTINCAVFLISSLSILGSHQAEFFPIDCAANKPARLVNQFLYCCH